MRKFLKCTNDKVGPDPPALVVEPAPDEEAGTLTVVTRAFAASDLRWNRKGFDFAVTPANQQFQRGSS